MTTYLSVLVARLRAHLDHRTQLLRGDPDGGYSTETVVVTAILVALAIAVVGVVIYNKVVDKATGITF